jgi:hypothetical protein
MDELKLALSYEWQSILMREKVEYMFPLTITPFMRMRYREPAVYRWIIYQRTAEDKKLVYIGEAQELCPKRLYGYLNPGPGQETNKRIKAEFEGYLREGLNIRLDICNIHGITFGDSILGRESLVDKYIRRLIVAAMVVEHRKRGFNVLDL